MGSGGRAPPWAAPPWASHNMQNCQDACCVPPMQLPLKTYEMSPQTKILLERAVAAKLQTSAVDALVCQAADDTSPPAMVVLKSAAPVKPPFSVDALLCQPAEENTPPVRPKNAPAPPATHRLPAAAASGAGLFPKPKARGTTVPRNILETQRVPHALNARAADTSQERPQQPRTTTRPHGVIITFPEMFECAHSVTAAIMAVVRRRTSYLTALLVRAVDAVSLRRLS